VSTLSLIDEDRQFFKSGRGLPPHLVEARQTPLTHSFCKHVVYQDSPLIVDDSRTHPTVMENPAIATLGVAAYAGMPVRDEAGIAIGSLCAISDVPREWTADELETLKLLAEQASAEIAVRSTSLRMGLNLAEMHAAEARRQQMVRLDRHDLRTPLNAILMSISSVPILGEVNEAQEECVAVAKRNGHALLTILDRMLEIGNIDHQGTGALDLAERHPRSILTQAVEQVGSLAKERGIVLKLADATDLPTLTVDGDKIVRVLVNLLGNAIKFSDEGGRVSVSAKLRETEEGGVEFSVRDNGIGIPADQVERIFLEGVHLNADTASRRSSGLGLTFCKTVVEVHGGQIWVERSAPGEGSTFSFYLPTSLPSAEK
ncbi:MAG: ATP-binding protein, partial [Chthoniobacterales bacterium]